MGFAFLLPFFFIFAFHYFTPLNTPFTAWVVLLDFSHVDSGCNCNAVFWNKNFQNAWFMCIPKKIHQLQLKNGMCIPFHSITFQKKNNYHLKNHSKSKTFWNKWNADSIPLNSRNYNSYHSILLVVTSYTHIFYFLQPKCFTKSFSETENRKLNTKTIDKRKP